MFGPRPMCLQVGEPIHQMVARALRSGAIRVRGDILPYIHYHFRGAHGVEYRGKWGGYENTATRIAMICEEVQSDFNERAAAMNKAREFARKECAIKPLFSSVLEESA